LRRNTPGPFTFILKANKEVPRIFSNRKKTVGVRIPENKIAMAIIEALDRPILSISLKNDDEILEYLETFPPFIQLLLHICYLWPLNLYNFYEKYPLAFTIANH